MRRRLLAALLALALAAPGPALASDALMAYLPGVVGWHVNTTFSTVALDTTTDKQAVVFHAPEAVALTHAGFRYGVRTGTPPTYRISLQGVDASGNPTGTVLGGGSPASATFTPPADATWNSTWQWVALSNSYTPARGELMAVVIDYSSGTVDGTNNGSFTYANGASIYQRATFPYPLLDTTGSWAKPTLLDPSYAVKSATRVYGVPVVAFTNLVASTSGHRVALKVTLPSGWAATWQAVGVRFNASTPAAGQTWIVGLWDSAGAVLQAVTLDSDQSASTTSDRRFHEVWWDDTPVTLSFGATYYVGIERVGSNVQLNTLEVASVDELTAFPLGASAHAATWNGSAWSDVSTQRPAIELILKDITAPVGGPPAHGTPGTVPSH
jgi:hypothetical protein